MSARLESELSIKTAWQLANADPKLLRRYFSVYVERTARELCGIPCFPFGDTGPERKQQIISSRTFGEKIYRLNPCVAPWRITPRLLLPSCAPREFGKLHSGLRSKQCLCPRRALQRNADHGAAVPDR